MRTLSGLCLFLALVYFEGNIEEAAQNQCFQCMNYDDKGKFYEKCPKDGRAVIGWAAFSGCDGPCFYRGDATNKNLIVRGCTAFLGTLPVPLPPDGCYDWNGAIFCVCRMPICNIVPLPEKSSGVSLDYLVNITAEPEGPDDGILKCYQCLNYDDKGNYYPQCPMDGNVNRQTTFADNCTGACFTRSYSDNRSKVARGCTASQYGLPYPLPADGCYDWDEATYCICSKSKCNGGAIGKSNGIEMDAHLDIVVTDFEEDGTKHCYQCVNYDKAGNYYKQCPKNSRVKNAYHAACNGSCFIKSYDYDARMVARGCTDSQYNLPDPLPPDGCYKYYSEVWCVCTRSRCNGVALGVPQNIEFDAHIPKAHVKTNGSGSLALPSQLLNHLLCIVVLCTFVFF